MRARLSSQAFGVIPKFLSSIVQSIMELAGRFAGVRYSEVVIGITFFNFKVSYPFAILNIFEAKPYHVVLPPPQCHLMRP
jgi:hypothetical protein